MRILALLALLALPLPALPAAASDAIEACRAAHRDDPAAHIGCLEAALRGPVAAPAPPAAAPVRSAAESPPRVAPEVSPPAASSSLPGPTPVAETPTGLGAEQVVASQRQADPTADAATVRVISATYNLLELGTFRLDNGQVWRETMKSPAHRRLAPDTEYTARIERGRAGGYRMRVDGIKWMKRVERLE